MTFLHDDSLANQTKLDLAHEELKAVEEKLREERRILNRDWAQMSPRERSSQSRVVKELENRRDALQETIESFGRFWNGNIEYSKEHKPFMFQTFFSFLAIFAVWIIWIYVCVLENRANSRSDSVSIFPVIPLFPFAFWGIMRWLNNVKPSLGSYVIGGFHLVIFACFVFSIYKSLRKINESK